MKRNLMLGLLAACLLKTFVANAAPQTRVQPEEKMSIQIIKQELNLTKTSFKSIGLIEQPDGTYTAEVVLTPKAAKQMHDLMASNIKKSANIVWKNNIVSVATIQSPLGDKFQIAGFTNEQAKSFKKEMQPENQKF